MGLKHVLVRMQAEAKGPASIANIVAQEWEDCQRAGSPVMSQFSITP
jgi:hypothetical protein